MDNRNRNTVAAHGLSRLVTDTGQNPHHLPMLAGSCFYLSCRAWVEGVFFDVVCSNLSDIVKNIQNAKI